MRLSTLKYLPKHLLDVIDSAVHSRIRIMKHISSLELFWFNVSSWCHRIKIYIDIHIIDRSRVSLNYTFNRCTGLHCSCCYMDIRNDKPKLESIGLRQRVFESSILCLIKSRWDNIDPCSCVRVGGSLDAGGNIIGAIFCNLPPFKIKNLANSKACIQNDSGRVDSQSCVMLTYRHCQPAETYPGFW